MPIFRVKSVKIYTDQKKFTRIYSWRSWQIWGMVGGDVYSSDHGDELHDDDDNAPHRRFPPSSAHHHHDDGSKSAQGQTAGNVNPAQPYLGKSWNSGDDLEGGAVGAKGRRSQFFIQKDIKNANRNTADNTSIGALQPCKASPHRPRHWNISI